MVSLTIRRLPPGLFRCQLEFSDTSLPSVAFQINAVDLLKISLGDLPSAFVRSTSGHIIGEVTAGPNDRSFMVRFPGKEYRIPRETVVSYLPEKVPVYKPRVAEDKTSTKPDNSRVFPRRHENTSGDDDTRFLSKGIH